MCCFFFFNDTATTEIYPLPLHDALPIWAGNHRTGNTSFRPVSRGTLGLQCTIRRLRARREHCRPSVPRLTGLNDRSEEHTSELQSRSDLVCRLLLQNNKILSVPQHNLER